MHIRERRSQGERDRRVLVAAAVLIAIWGMMSARAALAHVSTDDVPLSALRE